MKNKSIKTLKAKLDKVFSLYIRQRDSLDSNGTLFFKCISCGKIKPFEQADCGHYYGRANMALRFDEKNCNSQCRKCNRFSEGNRQGYAIGLQEKFGKTILDTLQIKSLQLTKMAVFEYEVLIKHYQDLLKDIKKN